MINQPKSCCFTGYRPQKFPFPLSRSDNDYLEFENRLTDAIFSLPELGCLTFYTGMEMGFDLIAAETVLLYRQAKKNSGVKLIGVIPFKKQSLSYTADWRRRYNRVAAFADELIVLSDNYTQGCYQKRNKYMVDRSDIVITWYSGEPGGTRSTLRYAASKDKRTVNLFEDFSHSYL